MDFTNRYLTNVQRRKIANLIFPRAAAGGKEGASRLHRDEELHRRERDAVRLEVLGLGEAAWGSGMSVDLGV